MQPIYVTKQILVAGSTNFVGNISTAATPVVTVNSSNMPLDTQRRIIFTSTAADTSSLKLTFIGTQQGGNAVTESIVGSTTGAGSVATTRQDFLTVTSIVASSNANVPILVGTSSVAGTPWQMANWQIGTPNFSAQTTINSSQMTASWEFTLLDITGTYPSGFSSAISSPIVFVSSGITGAVGSSGATLGTSATSTLAGMSIPIAAWRVTVTSSSSTYATYATVMQAGIG